MTQSVATPFRKRFLGGQRLIGTFIKTPTVHSIEIIGGLGFDFVVIDAEHAPFDRASIDLAMLAARAAGIAALVRTAGRHPETLLAALDDGAAGVVVPHVNGAEDARQVADACRYSGSRGFSNSPRAGGYGAAGLWPHVTASDEATTVIAMIEDPAAVDDIEQILAVDGLDGVFIGRGDLAVAIDDRAPGAPAVSDAARKVALAARAAGKPVAVFVADAAEAPTFCELGVTAFVVSSDQGMLRAAGAEVLTAFGGL